MNRSASLFFLFHIAALTLAAAQPGFVAGAGRKPPTAEETPEYEEKERKFNFYLDQGLSAYINEQNYELAIRNFEAALVFKPKDPTARKGLRLAREKTKSSAQSASPTPAEVRSSTEFVSQPTLTPGATTEAPSFIPAAAEPVAPSTAAALTVPPAEIPVFTPVQAPPPPSLIEYPVKEDPERAAREKEHRIKDRYREGVLSYMGEDYSKAVKAMESILELDPGNAKARKLLMKAYSFTK